jgi:hypothetical protein
LLFSFGGLSDHDLPERVGRFVVVVVGLVRIRLLQDRVGAERAELTRLLVGARGCERPRGRRLRGCTWKTRSFFEREVRGYRDERPLPEIRRKLGNGFLGEP